ncbi:MAG: sulfurtransferase-like selenium metabolism protein YedF [Desulfomonile tiedjei]|nr:sulfurtransferase-like selenium metabolism protein YedF [Desulfomonile tiedjei]
MMADLFTVDARGLTCPQPVLETKKVLDEGLANRFRVLVDNETSRENVSRFARNKGCEVVIDDSRQDGCEITITRTAGEPIPAHQEPLLPCPVPDAGGSGKLVVYVGNDCMGRGDDELGAKLMRGFLHTCIDVEPHPWRMIFINAGVKLATQDAAAVEALGVLQDKGVELLSCGTCLQHFGLEAELKVGRVTNMFEVIETLSSATKVISPD